MCSVNIRERETSVVAVRLPEVSVVLALPEAVPIVLLPLAVPERPHRVNLHRAGWGMLPAITLLRGRGYFDARHRDGEEYPR